MGRKPKVKIAESAEEPVEEPVVQKVEEPDSILAKKQEKQRLFQERKQKRLNDLVEARALELMAQQQKEEEPIVDEEVIVVKKKRKPKQKKVVYIEEDEEVEDYVYKQTKPNIPIQIRYW
jgi:hypothetical protein